MQFARFGSMLVLCAIGAASDATPSEAREPSAAREPSSAQSDASAPRERFVCTFGGTQRLIDIYRLGAGGGCRVDYTRNGDTKQLWSAHGDYAYCVKKAVGLVTRLSKGHFSCRPRTAEAGVESSTP